MIGSGGKILAVQRGQAVRLPSEEFAEGRKELRLTVFAEPLKLVFILVGTEPGEFGDTRIKPAEGIREFKRVELANLVPVAESDEA